MSKNRMISNELMMALIKKSTDRNILKPLECTGTLDGSNSLQHK